ncbi:MAG: hypothetical protein B7Z55_07710 [Planctomycetales bacterium 12-60-4]|nr:MAG: hypothetical protein B7Z55_07710 [Planctomycetales bacterium 12-60-4]
MPACDWKLLTSILITLFAIGCDRDSEGPELAVVNGTIKYQGDPLENAMVLFLPDTPGDPSASATTDASGRYRLQSATSGNGAIVGRYRVTVTARGPDKVLPEGQSLSGLPGGNTEPGEPLIPSKYFLPDTSGLIGLVESGKNTIDFELTK